MGVLSVVRHADAEVRAWEGYDHHSDLSLAGRHQPEVLGLGRRRELSTTVQGAITYPYVMQDHLSRKRSIARTRRCFLENEYLKVTCLPELGGRLHSVFDKTEGEEMFHLNDVIKPGMIAMRGAWISGGVEWNSGPHGHTVTVLSPVDALVGHNPDGSAYLEISNQEKIFRTRWTVRVTLHPGKAYLDEQIRIDNPTDGMHPYYFWNCTAFPNRPGTRFIYPMTLGTDHNAREFFRWPIHEGRDLSWLKNYETYASIFSVDCTHDFFGAYDVDADRGIVQVANHHELGGKKAWTWGEWEFRQGRSEEPDGSRMGPTSRSRADRFPRSPTTACWVPTNGSPGRNGGIRFTAWATVSSMPTARSRHRRIRRDGRLELRLLATGEYPRAVCTLQRGGHSLAQQQLDLTPAAPAVITLAEQPEQPVEVTVTDQDGRVLAAFTTPLPIPQVDPPDPDRFLEQPDDQLTVEQLYLKGRKLDRATDRRGAREYYGKALARDPGHLLALRSLAVLDFEAGLYDQAIAGLEKALARDSDDGLSWFYLGVCSLRLGETAQALDCGYRAVRCPGTVSLGYDLVGRAAMREGDLEVAVEAFRQAVRANGDDPSATDHLMLALYASGQTDAAGELAQPANRPEPDSTRSSSDRVTAQRRGAAGFCCPGSFVRRRR